MNILVTQLPSGGVGYNFSSVTVNPMTFQEITKYLENLPDDELDRYAYDINMLMVDDQEIAGCYVMDVDFLIFFKKLITVSSDLSFNISVTCPECGNKITKTIWMDKSIKFKSITPEVMNGAVIELGGHKYDTIIPTVADLRNVMTRYLRYRTITDLKMIKTISLFKDWNMGNMVENDILGAKHSDVTLLLALNDLYFDRVEKLTLYCDCKGEEGRGVTVSVESLIVDFFREICINSPIDGSKILFK